MGGTYRKINLHSIAFRSKMDIVSEMSSRGGIIKAEFLELKI